MKTEQEVRNKLRVVEREAAGIAAVSTGDTTDQVLCLIKQQRVEALKWVLDELEEW